MEPTPSEAIDEMLRRLKEREEKIVQLKGLLAETNNRLSVFVSDANGHVIDVRKILEEK